MKFRGRLRALEQRFGITPELPQPILFRIYEASGPRDAEGRIPEAVSGCVDDVSAERIERLPGETLDRFKERLMSLPHKEPGCAHRIFLFPPDQPLAP
jgi:hypothetical protein